MNYISNTKIYILKYVVKMCLILKLVVIPEPLEFLSSMYIKFVTSS